MSNLAAASSIPQTMSYPAEELQPGCGEPMARSEWSVSAVLFGVIVGSLALGVPSRNSWLIDAVFHFT
jgi:hypothetical protein